MCGRAAQSRYSVATAASLLGSSCDDNGGGPDIKQHDNLNLSPGQAAFVFHKSSSSNNGAVAAAKTGEWNCEKCTYRHKANTTRCVMCGELRVTKQMMRDFVLGKKNQSDNKPVIKTENVSVDTTAAAAAAAAAAANKVTCTSKIWGLVPRKGTPSNPLQLSNPSQHFSYKMFNARSDTLYDKISFRNLALRGNTCVIAVDGFYEWKNTPKHVTGSGSGKQPYFVHRRDKQPLLLAGLWTSVPTGLLHDDDNKLDTFTIITTSSAKQLQWLHSRQPLILKNAKSALGWIHSPSKTILQQMAEEASLVDCRHDSITWHPVTKRMSNGNYRGEDCVEPIALGTVPSVKQFFGSGDGVRSLKRKKEKETEEDYLKMRKKKPKPPSLTAAPKKTAFDVSHSSSALSVRSSSLLIKREMSATKGGFEKDTMTKEIMISDKEEDNNLKETQRATKQTSNEEGKGPNKEHHHHHDYGEKSNPYILEEEEEEKEKTPLSPSMLPANKRIKIKHSSKSSPLFSQHNASSSSSSILSSFSSKTNKRPTTTTTTTTTARRTKNHKKLQTITSFFAPKKVK